MVAGDPTRPTVRGEDLTVDFTPHTDDDVAVMLEAVGLNQVSELFSHLPTGALLEHLPDLPEPVSELEVMQIVDALGNETNRISFVSPAAATTTTTYHPL